MIKQDLKVYPAEPYEYGRMGTFGKASNMLIKQYCFPDTYDEKDQILRADHDRCKQWDYEHATGCIKKHTGWGEMGIGGWVEKSNHEKVFAFLKDILKADEKVAWTGYRVTGSVNRSNGYPVFSLELFSKHPESDTKVYSGVTAPNVLPGPRT
jgi:hypothetical protein